ncbi:hypothetical protein ACFYXS_15760 [Streptomyces sp. NPDC002574]|uniref:hypothetical protein n=1 Tax=Streptomyces sp. NPDC002574 TaxID=3364652 RepID=UPI0036C27282
MDIKWGSLGSVFGASLGITILVVVMFSLGIAAWGRAGGGPEGASGPEGTRNVHRGVALGSAALCFAACLAVAAYGIELIIPG